MKTRNPVSLDSLLNWVMAIDVDRLTEEVALERAARPNVTPAQLIDEAFTRARRHGTTASLLTGLPANPWIAVPAASLDTALTLRVEMEAVARAALIHDPTFFSDDEAVWSLLVPVFGLGASSQLLRALGVSGSHYVTRSLLQHYFAREGLRTFRHYMLRQFGLRVTRRGVIGKTVPIVGAIVGAGWTYAEIGGIKARTLSYLRHRIPADHRLEDSAAPSRLTQTA